MADRDQWFKFYPDKWQGDLELKSCSLEAQGYWICLIAIMHNANPYGTLCISGEEPTHKVLSSILGIHPSKSRRCLQELEDKKVAKRDENGFIYSQFLRELKEKRDKAIENGSKGGNPNIIKGGVNPPVNTPVKLDKEVRNKKEEKDIYSVSFIEFWNLWPTGRKIDKKSCQQKWNRIKESELGNVITGTKNYISANKGKDIEYLKHPLTLLNKETWRDYLNWQPPEDTTVREQPYTIDGEGTGKSVIAFKLERNEIELISGKDYKTIDQTKDPPGDMSKAKESVNALAERMGGKA